MAAPRGIRPTLKGNVDEALRLFAMEAEWGGLNVDETEFVLEEALKCYGSIADGSQIRTLFAFYRRYLGMADLARRQALLTRITEFISDGRQNRYLALLCFLNADTDGQIISGAALDISMVMPRENGDPLTGPKHVALHGCGGLRAKMGGSASDDEGHAAAGLLLLGDMRLLPMLEEIWERLSPKARVRMVQRRSNLASALAVEFLLRRLEADTKEEYHGELGAFLFNLAEIASKQPVKALLDIRRNFGLPPGLEPMELVGKETMAEAFARIQPRLKALIDRESEPKVLPSAYAVWANAAGVAPEPTTSSDDSEESAEEESEDEDDGSAYMARVLDQELHEEFSVIMEDDELPPEIFFYENPYMVRDVTPSELQDELSPQKFLPLLVTGIFNPFGPTLCVYGVQDEGTDDWRVMRYQLNPFSCVKGPVAMLDGEKTSFATGDFDEAESEKRKTLVAHGRTTPSLDVVQDILTRIVLGKSRLQVSFSLCVSSARISKQKSLERVATVYQAIPKARQELNDLHDKKKRTDPWARADMEEVMKRIHDPLPEPAPLTPAEASELAAIVLDRNQQRIEMTNLLAAWEGAIGFSPLTPVLSKKQLLGGLVMLTPDMPNLVNHSDPFHPDDLTRDVPGATRAAAAPEPPAASAPQAEAKAEKKRSPSPDYRGLLGFIETFGLWELPLNIIGLVWALVCAQWLLALCLVGFFLLNFFRLALIAIRYSFSRWLAVANYGLMSWYLVDRLDPVSIAVKSDSPASVMLFKLLLGWFGIMGVLNLGFLTYAKRMKEAPELPEEKK
jgi:hypothetical protein